MSLTGSEMATYIKRIFKRIDKDTEIYEAITDTVMEMKLRIEFDKFKVEAYTESLTTSGDYKIEIPSDVGHIIGNIRCIDGTTSTVLEKLSKQEFDELYPNQSATGVMTAKPLHWCLYGEEILLGPVPDSADYDYEINYTTESAEDIVSGTTEVPFSRNNRECLRFGSLARLYAGLDDDEKAQKWQAFYEQELEKIVRLERNNSGAPANVEYQDY